MFWMVRVNQDDIWLSLGCFHTFYKHLPASCNITLPFHFEHLIFFYKRTDASSCLKFINHVKRLPLSLEIFLFLSKLIYFNWIRILIDLEIEHEKWNIGHDNLINVIGINFIYFNFWYLHPDAINLINAGEMTDFFI